MKKDVYYDLTSPQRNIWELAQINTEASPINHILGVLKLKGNLNERLLAKAINIIIEKNDSYRLKFKKADTDIFQYIEDYINVPIEIKHLNSEDISSIIEKYQNIEISFNKLFCFCLIFTPCYSYVLYKSHHIISDAWSMTQFTEQVKEIYERLVKNESIQFFSKPSYTEFINREHLYLESNKYYSDEQFWNDYVKRLLPSKLFNNDDNFQKKANRYQQNLEKNLFNCISDYCKENKITEYSFFLGILTLYFNKIYNLPSIVFGTPFLNRQKRLNELETIGMFVSTLPLIIDIDIKDTFTSLCKNINSTNMVLFKHSAFPYHKIQELYFKNSNENTSLYEIGFSYQINKQEKSLGNNDLGECTWVFSGEQNNPLTIHLTTLNDSKIINYDYWLSCFTQEEIERMNNIILHLISEVLKGKKNISDINVLTNSDVKLLSSFNNTGTIKNSKQTVVSIFNDIVKQYPENIAITFENENINYYDLDKKANFVAKYLLSLGVRKNTPVVLFFDKSIDMIVSILAVLKAGSCYIPILPDENPTRIKYILNDCKPKCVLTHKNYNKKITYKNIINLNKIILSDENNIEFPSISPQDTAYIIYTSGSTGNPKGTMVMHKNIVGLKNSIENDLILKATSKDISISLLKYSFDASGIDIYSSLLFGGKLVLVKKEDELNPEKVIRIMEKEKVTRSFLIPKWIEHISIQDKLLNVDLSNLKILGTGGETLKPYIIGNLLTKYKKLKILNLYGPTETTMFTTYKEITTDEIKNNRTTIGKPIYGSRVGVINSNLELMPINTKGELIIYEDDKSIVNIARGYLNLPEQTKNKFVQIYNPILNKKVNAYRTGDIVKINKNLEIEFIGRNDDIVKVNGGYLVALNEVENRIQKLLGNKFEVCPVAIPYKNTKSIILFLTKKEKNISLYNIKNHINNNISFYMKPKKIIELEYFPRNSSGKVDRKELQKIATQYMKDNKNTYIPPNTMLEIDIYNYIKELIEIDDFSITDDFIDDLGIDSLSLTSLYNYLEKYNINIQDIYSNSNIKDLANFIENNINCEIKPDLTNIDNIKILNNVKNIDLSTILITGTTGFLGIHLLRDLLINNNVKKIYCIIRNKINLNGKKRLQEMISYYFNSDNNLLELINKKVRILNGDITKDHFGLDTESYSEISNSVSTVINSAANVRHFVKPEQIRKDNVESVKKLIDFCKDKKLLVHISTLSIAGFESESSKNSVFSENTLFINQFFNNNPYLISKFEAEKYILEGTNKNKLNAIIFRLGNIMPRISDGVFQINANQNVFLSALKAIINNKLVAKDFLELKLEFSPVDECSKIIVRLLENNSSNSIYHILSDKEISISELIGILKSLNYDIVDTDLETFTDALNKNVDEYTKEYILSNNLNYYSQNITLKKMKQLNLEWSPIDTIYIQRILNIIKK